VAVGGDGKDELVGREAHGLLDEALLEELIGQLDVRRGKDVGLDALANLAASSSEPANDNRTVPPWNWSP
jgi:hypothetical protein